MIRCALFLTLLAAGGCLLVPDQGSCDGRPQEQSCTDLLENKNSHARSTLSALCVGTYSDDLCDHTGALGGCQCDGCENGVSIQWLFPDPARNINTAADVMAACGTKVFVAP